MARSASPEPARLPASSRRTASSRPTASQRRASQAGLDGPASVRQRPCRAVLGATFGLTVACGATAAFGAAFADPVGLAAALGFAAGLAAASEPRRPWEPPSRPRRPWRPPSLRPDFAAGLDGAGDFVPPTWLSPSAAAAVLGAAFAAAAVLATGLGAAVAFVLLGVVLGLSVTLNLTPPDHVGSPGRRSEAGRAGSAAPRCA